MVNESILSSRLLRCPVCLISQPVAADANADTRLICGNCKKRFSLTEALPLARADTNHRVDINHRAETLSKTQPSLNANHAQIRAKLDSLTHRTQFNIVRLLSWVLMIALCWLILTIARDYIRQLDGPEFLWLYGIYFIAIYFARWVWSAFSVDTFLGTLVSLVLFEGLGILRIIDGKAVGMSQFDITYILMFVGLLILCFRRDDRRGDGHASSVCSGCSGCGGGGGGCGGCGS